MNRPPSRRPDNPLDARRREAVYQRWTAMITREGVDDKTLDTIANRAFVTSEVADDPSLAAMLRAFIAQRRAELSAAARAHDHSGTAEVGSDSAETRAGEPDRHQTSLVFDRLLVELATHFAYLDEHGARAVLAKIEELQARYPQWIDERRVETARADLQGMLTKRDGMQRQVDELENRAVKAAQTGDHDTAATALKKLSAIHATRPSLMSDARLDNLRAALMAASEVEEHRAAARELIAREKAVLTEVRALAAAVHAFHEVARRNPHDSPEFFAAETNYRKTVRDVKTHDTEWLCELILELSDLIEEIHAPHGTADRQLDRFIHAVKRTLHEARAEILAIARENAPKSGKNP
ncbi:MAG: hypothetical protein JNG88_13815 [Phycisphaerales bacterium]|nr:hypothetical protein [Phycisphaerales bacterium]